MPSTTASCLCGNIKISFNADPANRVICYCLDCRKVSGSAFSDNVFVPNDDFALESGTPKAYTKKGDSGKDITCFFCPDCGNTVYREPVAMPGKKVIKVGTVDDPAWQSAPPKGELYSHQKLAWLPEWPAAAE